MTQRETRGPGPNKRFAPEQVRRFAIVWMGLIVVVGIVAFLVFITALNNRKERVAAEAEQQTQAAELQAALLTQNAPAPEGTPDISGEDLPEEEEEPVEVTPPLTVGLDDGFALGGQVPGFISHADVMRSAGMTWVKYQIKWNPTIDTSIAQQMIEGGHRDGFKVLLSISGDPYPQETIDYETYVTYLGQVAALQPDAIEVWNEMNLDREWPAGQISPESYVEDMLAPAYAAIKAASPQTDVIIGALAPTGFDNDTNAWSDARYVQGLGAAGAAEYADCVGVHHNAGTTSPSATSGHVSDPGDAHYSWYFLPTLEVYYEGLNQELPVCLTEFGYFSPDGFDGPVPDNFAWGASNTLEEHVTWLAEGSMLAQQLGYVPLMIVWNVDFEKWESDDPQAGYAILRPDGTCPACAALRSTVQ